MIQQRGNLSGNVALPLRDRKADLAVERALVQDATGAHGLPVAERQGYFHVRID